MIATARKLITFLDGPSRLHLGLLFLPMLAVALLEMASIGIILPLIQPGLGAVAILVFIFAWNDFLIGAVLTTREEMRPVQVGLVRLIHDSEGVWWGQFTAFAILAIAPVLVAFFLVQKRFIEGLTSGGVKG